MKNIGNKNKIIIFSLILIIISSIIITHYYLNESSTVNEKDTTSIVKEDSNSKNVTSYDIDFPNTIILSWPEEIINYNNVTFIWTGEDDNTKTKNIMYSYKLDGYTNTWSSWDTLTSITYTDLPNGEYTFFVKAKDQAGNIDPISVEEFFIVNMSVDDQTLQSYYVYWTVIKDTLSLYNPYFVGKKQSFQKNITIPQYNLKQIKFVLNWEDDMTSPIFHFGKDVLTFSIKSSDETVLYSQKSKGKGTYYYNITDVNNKPIVEMVKAEDDKSANSMVEQYYGTNLFKETFFIEVNLKIGEIRLLPRFREKGNDFTLEIKYEYYKPQISKIKDNPPETSITFGPSGIINEKYVEFSWDGIDDFTPVDMLKYSYKLEPYEKTWSKWTKETSVKYEDLSIGRYSFFIRSKDNKDNIDQTPAERTFTIKEIEKDRTPPTIEILSGPSGIIGDTTFLFTWRGEDDKTPSDSLKYRYKLEGKDGENSWSSWNNIIQKEYVNIFNGEYTFKVEVKDDSGNWASNDRSFNVEQWDHNRFITQVLYYSGTGDLEKIKGVPHGCGMYCGCENSVLTLGNNGQVIVGFNISIVNGDGNDFIVFENPFMVSENQNEVFAELFYVEVSTDNISFARFPSISLTAEPVLNKGININNVTNLGGVHPVLSNAFENNLNPFDYEQAGGDPFDLEDLSDDPLVQIGLVDLNNINYIRLIDIPGDGSCLDSLGNPIYDPTEPDVNGADIDAISIINYI